MLPQLAGIHSARHSLGVAVDRTTTIRASVHDVEITLLISIGLVVLVVFVFLRNGWATFIPSVAVPLSLLGTFGIMYLVGYTLDNLSLMALTISTGFVVDDAIVVIENIARYLEQGMRPVRGRAARRAGDRFHRDVDEHLADGGVHSDSADGRHRRPAVPRICRGAFRRHRRFRMVVSLTTTPMMSARFLRAQPDQKHGRLYNWSESVLRWILDAYACTACAVSCGIPPSRCWSAGDRWR